MTNESHQSLLCDWIEHWAQAAEKGQYKVIVTERIIMANLSVAVLANQEVGFNCGAHSKVQLNTVIQNFFFTQHIISFLHVIVITTIIC